MSYLHGYGPEEASRLRAQARVLEPWVHNERFFDEASSILEVGCGAGGQTALLLERYPQASVTALEREESHVHACDEFLRADDSRSARARVIHGDALSMPEGVGLHDAAFICWVLEHCTDPVAMLRATRECLSPGGKLVIHEVFAQSWFIGPHHPEPARSFYDAYNAHQRELGGDPDVGAQLGQHLFDAGYEEIQTSVVLIQLDDRAPDERAKMFDYLGRLLRSGEDELIKAGKKTQKDAQLAERTLQEMGRAAGTTFTYAIMRAVAHAPR